MQDVQWMGLCRELKMLWQLPSVWFMVMLTDGTCSRNLLVSRWVWVVCISFWFYGWGHVISRPLSSSGLSWCIFGKIGKDLVRDAINFRNYLVPPNFVCLMNSREGARNVSVADNLQCYEMLTIGGQCSRRRLIRRVQKSKGTSSFFLKKGQRGWFALRCLVTRSYAIASTCTR